jgi:hypothetical protein
MSSSGGGDAASILLHEVYAAELRVHAVMLIWLGYQRLKQGTLAGAEEDDITGELVREMKFVVQDPESPPWVEHYEIDEQVRQNVPGKRGKGRPIMDIEVERHQRGPRPRLGFEAKRLGRGHATGGYLGSEGMSAFLSGYYPTTHGEAGMIGYVQEETSAVWSGRIADEITRNPNVHRLAMGGALHNFDPGPAMPAFRSAHSTTDGKPLVMIHVLLSFVA